MTERRDIELRNWAKQLQAQANDPRLSRAEREHIRKVHTALLNAIAEGAQRQPKGEAA